MPLTVAPGQIVTLLVAGVGSTLTQTVQASGGNALPNTLAGISVTLRQGAGTRSVPLLEVRPVSTCSNPQPAGSPNTCGRLTAVTVQIPFEIRTLCLLCLSPVSVEAAQLFVNENGVDGAGFDLSPLSDQIHIVTSCDVTVDGGARPVSLTGLPCPPMVRHADGSLVSAAQPAKASEEVVAYAFGLGQTNPAAVTGAPVAIAAASLNAIAIDFNFHSNALPARPVQNQWFVGPAPVFAGSTPGFVGLYQINFVVPPLPAGTPTCAGSVHSNFTVSFAEASSFDGAGICVEP